MTANCRVVYFERRRTLPLPFYLIRNFLRVFDRKVDKNIKFICRQSRQPPTNIMHERIKNRIIFSQLTKNLHFRLYKYVHSNIFPYLLYY